LCLADGHLFCIGGHQSEVSIDGWLADPKFHPGFGLRVNYFNLGEKLRGHPAPRQHWHAALATSSDEEVKGVIKLGQLDKYKKA
jgi:hypothetical protein